MALKILYYSKLFISQVGENMKQLELSAEKAVEREEKLKEKILSIQQKFKAAEGRWA